MFKINLNNNYTKLRIKTHDYNVTANQISCFIIELVEEVFPLLDIKEPKKKKRLVFSRFNLNYLFMLKYNILAE